MDHYTNLLFQEDECTRHDAKRITVSDWWEVRFPGTDFAKIHQANLTYSFGGGSTTYIRQGDAVYSASFATEGCSLHLLNLEMLERDFKYYREQTGKVDLYLISPNRSYVSGAGSIMTERDFWIIYGQSRGERMVAGKEIWKAHAVRPEILSGLKRNWSKILQLIESGETSRPG